MKILLKKRCPIWAVDGSLYLRLNAFCKPFPVKGNFTGKNGMTGFKKWKKCRQQEMIYLVLDQIDRLCLDQQAFCHRATLLHKTSVICLTAVSRP